MHAELACESHCENSSDGESVPDESEPHMCAVTLLNAGATVSVLLVLPIRSDLLIANLSIDSEVLWRGQAPLRFNARAPPIETVV
ncbi:MAG: hypothetical protein ABF330_01230 [Lentimonas sp.]